MDFSQIQTEPQVAPIHQIHQAPHESNGKANGVPLDLSTSHLAELRASGLSGNSFSLNMRALAFC